MKVGVSGIEATVNSSTQFSMVCELYHKTSFKIGISPLRPHQCSISEFVLNAESAVLLNNIGNRMAAQ